MRKVIWGEYKLVENIWKLIEQGEALFHRWGVDTYSEDDGGSFSTAIIELEDGTVKNIPAEQVRFISGEIEDSYSNSKIKEELKNQINRYARLGNNIRPNIRDAQNLIDMLGGDLRVEINAPTDAVCYYITLLAIEKQISEPGFDTIKELKKQALKGEAIDERK